jgi:Zn-finger nucleic acid-binding protein
MDCPHCHAPLINKDYEHISLFTCEKCAGIWLEPIQLSEITTMSDTHFIPEEVQDVLLAAQPGPSALESLTGLRCPKCSRDMHTINYDYSSDVIVNVCSLGDGLWFDKKELEHVHIFMEHWDNQETSRKKELLTKLKKAKQDMDDELAGDPYENDVELTFPVLLDRLFLLFDAMKKQRLSI